MNANFNRLVFWLSLVAAFMVALSLLVAYSSHKGGALGVNLIIVTAILLFYVLAKCVFAHKSIHVRRGILDFLFEHAILPVMAIYLLTRYMQPSHEAALTDVGVFVLLTLFVDPLGMSRKHLSDAEFIVTGRFLRPITSEYPVSNNDYLAAFFSLAVCYFILWWQK